MLLQRQLIIGFAKFRCGSDAFHHGFARSFYNNILKHLNVLLFDDLIIIYTIYNILYIDSFVKPRG